MYETTVKVDGMMCGMCESHINDAIRSKFNIKKITSSHSKGETIIISEDKLDEKELKDVINATGYTAVSVNSAPYEKRGFFSHFKK